MPEIDVTALYGHDAQGNRITWTFPDGATKEQMLAFVKKNAPPRKTKSGRVAPKKLYEAIRAAETGGEQDPWIRTKVSGSTSSAYGPVQITKTLAEDYLNRKASLFSPEEQTYLSKFIEQGNKFLEFGRAPDKPGYDPRYEYGGQGDLTTERDKKLYQSVALKMLQDHLEQAPSVISAVEKWRGVGRQNDPQYFDKVLAALEGADGPASRND